MNERHEDAYEAPAMTEFGRVEDFTEQIDISIILN
jgi:hypothetical protein